MPEASVDEHRDFGANKRDIGAAPCAGQCDIDSVTEAKRAEGSAQSNFSWRVSPAGRLHSATNFRRRRGGSGQLLTRIRP